jgi:hypothetical protein
MLLVQKKPWCGTNISKEVDPVYIRLKIMRRRDFPTNQVVIVDLRKIYATAHGQQ